MFGELFVQADTLIIKKLVVYQLDINQVLFLRKKLLKENINGHFLVLHTNQVGMICYFNFLTLNHHFFTKQNNLMKKF